MTRAGRGLLLLCACLLFAVALAQRVEVDTGGDPDSRLEIRTVTLPDGREARLYVITGDPVVVRVEEQRIEARHIEFDPDARLLRVIGPGRVERADEVLIGEDLVVELDEERVDGREVLVVLSAVDVTGTAATRVRGRISVLSGAFSPCARCGQEVNDYGFRAERIEVLPGDRLIAYDVTVLVRGNPLFALPLLVVPLADAERRPRFSVQRGGADRRAALELDWPYVAGANAYGTVSLRTWADVAAEAGGPLLDPLLGGAPRTWYVGGGLDHRFFDEVGSGRFRVAYTPSFLDADEPDGRTRPLLELEASYRTDTPEADPILDLWLARDDAVRIRRIQAAAVVEAERSGVVGRASAGLAVPLDPDEGFVPLDTARGGPQHTLGRIELAPEELDDWALGPLSLEALELDTGAFRDRSNPANRSAATRRDISALRVRTRHRIELARVSPWAGAEVWGLNDFLGHYYDTGERLIDWDTQLDARQAIGGLGALSVRFRRDIAEGETPFRFDRIPLRSRTEARADLDLQPAPWLRLAVRGGHLLRDSRRPGDEGWLPLESELALFGDRRWIGVTFDNEVDLQEGDPGELRTQLDLRAPTSAFGANLHAEYVHDLAVRADPEGARARDTSRAELDAAVQFRPYLELDAHVSYAFDPERDEDEPHEPWGPLELGATVGTMGFDDPWPGLRIAFERDLNRGRVSSLSYQARLGRDPVRIELDQRYDLPDGGAGSNRYRVAWQGVAALRVEGPQLIPAPWLGLPPGEPEPVRWSVRLEDAPERGQQRWNVTWRGMRDPDLDGTPGWRGSVLEANARFEQAVVGDVRFSVDGFLDAPLADEQQPSPYLRRAGLGLAVSVAGRVGLQGSIGYRGRYDAASDEVTSARLAFDALTLTARPLDDLYLGARLDDAWELTGEDADAPPFDLRPTLFFALDRCCWALYGSWDATTGEVTLTLGAPGADEGLQAAFESGLALPEPRAGEAEMEDP